MQTDHYLEMTPFLFTHVLFIIEWAIALIFFFFFSVFLFQLEQTKRKRLFRHNILVEPELSYYQSCAAQGISIVVIAAFCLGGEIRDHNETQKTPSIEKNHEPKVHFVLLLGLCFKSCLISKRYLSSLVSRCCHFLTPWR